MKLLVIGSGTGLIRKRRKAPSFLLKTGKELLLFDCGWGSTEGLLKAGTDPLKINHFFISHSHADHLAELIPFLQARIIFEDWFGSSHYPDQINLHGYPGFPKDYLCLRKIMLPDQERGFRIKVYQYQNQKRQFKNFSVWGQSVKHAQPLLKSVAFRIETNRKTFVYTGDCKNDPNLVALSWKADLLLAEASIPPQKFTQNGAYPAHLSPQEAGMIAQKAGVKKLALFHLYDLASLKETKAAAQKYFSGEVIITQDQMEILL